MIDYLSSKAGEWVLIFAPAMLVAVVILAAGAKALHGSVVAAFVSVVLMTCAAIALGAGSIYALHEFYVADEIAACEELERQGPAYDCEDAGLILFYPLVIAIVAIVFIVIGAAIIRMMRRRI